MSEAKSIDLEKLRKIKGTCWLQGNEYVLLKGLLLLAHENGLKKSSSIMVEHNPKEGSAVFKAVVEGERGTYEGHGQASPANLKRHMQPSYIMMAETKALCRALRWYLGIGMTASEELPGFTFENETPVSAPEDTPKKKTAPLKSQTKPKTIHKCAVCGEVQTSTFAQKTKDIFDLVLCEKHQAEWTKPTDPYWDTDKDAFLATLEELDVEYLKLQVRCVNSEKWSGPPHQMKPKERGQLLHTLRSHFQKKDKMK